MLTIKALSDAIASLGKKPKYEYQSFGGSFIVPAHMIDQSKHGARASKRRGARVRLSRFERILYSGVPLFAFGERTKRKHRSRKFNRYQTPGRANPEVPEAKPNMESPEGKLHPSDGPKSGGLDRHDEGGQG